MCAPSPPFFLPPQRFRLRPFHAREGGVLMYLPLSLHLAWSPRFFFLPREGPDAVSQVGRFLLSSHRHLPRLGFFFFCVFTSSRTGAASCVRFLPFFSGHRAVFFFCSRTARRANTSLPFPLPLSPQTRFVLSSQCRSDASRAARRTGRCWCRLSLLSLLLDSTKCVFDQESPRSRENMPVRFFSLLFDGMRQLTSPPLAAPEQRSGKTSLFASFYLQGGFFP